MPYPSEIPAAKWTGSTIRAGFIVRSRVTRGHSVSWGHYVSGVCLSLKCTGDDGECIAGEGRRESSAGDPLSAFSRDLQVHPTQQAYIKARKSLP